ncbi:MAG: GtrA family protein [Syntrophobacteraceae bacterium]
MTKRPLLPIQFLKFCAVGFLNTAIQYGTFLVLFRGLDIHYLVASGIGYWLGFLNSFAWNKLWTFAARGGRTRVEFARFAAVNLASFAINIGLLDLFVRHWSASPEPAQALALAFAVCVNFLGNKLWTFRPAA